MEEKHRLVKVVTIKHKEPKEIGTEWISANTPSDLGVSVQLIKIYEANLNNRGKAGLRPVNYGVIQ